MLTKNGDGAGKGRTFIFGREWLLCHCLVASNLGYSFWIVIWFILTKIWHNQDLFTRFYGLWILNLCDLRYVVVISIWAVLFILINDLRSNNLESWILIWDLTVKINYNVLCNRRKSNFMIAHIATMDSYPLSLACSHTRMCVCVCDGGGGWWQGF